MTKATTGALGCLAGGLLGYLMRPAAPFIGQLPFKAVITRGGSLTGVDQILLPIAQSSFNDLMLGLVGGLLAGLVVGHFAFSRGTRTPSA
jgi:hypothetical protein